MKLATPIIAGAAVLALANVALADEASLDTTHQPILLTDAQMDGVTAGDAGFGASVTDGIGSVSVNFASAFNDEGQFASSFIEVSFFTSSFVTGNAFAFADLF